MRKPLLLIPALALLGGLALADTIIPGPQVPLDPPTGLPDFPVIPQVDIGENSATKNQSIRLTIPKRVALHLTEDEWQLNLNNPPAAPGPYTLNPQNPQPPAEGCYLVPKSVRTIAQLQAYLTSGGILRPIGTYPAVADFNGDGRITDDEKGTLLCVNQKILQKFSNDPDGWRLSVSVSGSPATGFGIFALADFALNGGLFGGPVTVTQLPASPQVLAQGTGTTGGWLDDLIVEAFWFDGSEVDGTYNLTVTFSLASL